MKRITLLTTLALVLATAGCASAHKSLARSQWGRPTEREITAAKADKVPVIIAFDADGCHNSYNAKNFFDSTEGRKLLNTARARAFRVDCTKMTSECKDFMKQYGATSIPSYVILYSGADRPTVLSDAELTPDSFQSALKAK